MTEQFEWDRPVIVIGAGRSGSTMLSVLLGDHPELYNAGETTFLLNRLWEEFFRKPDFHTNYRIWNLIKSEKPEWNSMVWADFGKNHLSREIQDDRFPKYEAEEEPRLSQVLGKCMAESLVPPKARRRYWSFKEIWNGSGAFSYGWDRINLAFPEARFIHITRDPWTWGRSYFLNKYKEKRKIKIKRKEFIDGLHVWTRINAMSCQQERLNGRYMTIRYEEFLEYPEEAIRSVLSFVDLVDHPNCHASIKAKRYVPSKGELVLPSLSSRDIKKIPNFQNLMEKFGYQAVTA